MNVNLSFRPAQATDRAAAVALIYSSGIAAFDYCFRCKNSSAVDFLNFAFANGRGFFGWRNHTVAVLDDAVVGIGAFYNGSAYLRLSVELVWQILLFYPLHQTVRVFWHIFQLTSLMPPPAKNMHYVANFAVCADKRGQSIGTQFLQQQQQLARQLERKVCALDVAADNPRAQALYQRLEFKVIKTQKFMSKNNSLADTIRMELSLHNDQN